MKLVNMIANKLLSTQQSEFKCHANPIWEEENGIS